MTQQNQQAKDHQKHISMELTADGARVTNLSLQGSRLVLTIEAELADSQLHASDIDGRQALAAAFQPTIKQESNRGDETEFVDRPQSADAPSLGLAMPQDASSGALAMGSESLPPAPSAAFAPQPKSMAIDPGQISSPLEPALGLAPASESAPEPLPLPSLDAAPLSLDNGPAAADGGSASLEMMSDPFVEERNAGQVPPAPPLEPVREVTDTWDVSQDPMRLLRPADPDATVPIAGMGTPSAPSTSESAREIKLGDDPIAAPIPEFAPPPPAPANPVQPAPVQPPVAELRLGGDDDLSSPAQWGGVPSLTGESPSPMMENWDHNSLKLGDTPPDLLAMSEDSSAVGGARHGEPQPTISFGSDEPIALSPMPAPEPAPAPAAAPSVAPLSLEPMGGIGFETEAPSPAPAAPAAAPLSLEPLGGIGFEMEAPAPASPSAPTPAPALTPSPEPAPMSLSPIGFSDEPPPPPAPSPAPAPMAALSPSFLSEDAPTQMAMQPPPPEPAPEPKPEPAKSESAPSESDKDKNEAGGTTVLIRYTCPKCKTQGMQAVDKVGTVVNCSNCGKAMRLVMKK